MDALDVGFTGSGGVETAMAMRRISGTHRAVVAIAAALLLLTACGPAPPNGAPATPPYVTGVIRNIVRTGSALRVHVEAEAGSREPCGIMATVDGGTRITQRVPALADRPLRATDLTMGDHVEVHVDGPVAESCPVQAHASAVVRKGAP